MGAASSRRLAELLAPRPGPPPRSRARTSRVAQRRQLAAESITLIWCQRPGSAWQKACTALSGLGRKRSLTTKSTPEVPSDTNAAARRHGADAHRAGGVVAAAAGHHHRTAACPSARAVPCGARRRARSPRPGAASALATGRRGQHRVRPVALADVEPQRAGRVGHLARPSRRSAAGAGSPWAAARLHLGEDLRLVLARPRSAWAR